ncbi:MAG: hypothetical protein V3U76_03020 [Granulosicoccus sp.]
MNIKRPIWAALLLPLLMSAGCAGLRPAEKESQRQTIPKSMMRADGSVRVDTENEKIAELWKQAEDARLADNDPGALALIYQALELSPQNSLLWSRAAELQLDGLESAQAESFAMKSNMFAGKNNALLYRNWLIIEHARDQRGDLLGVRSAHKKVQHYQYQ